MKEVEEHTNRSRRLRDSCKGNKTRLWMRNTRTRREKRQECEEEEKEAEEEERRRTKGRKNRRCRGAGEGGCGDNAGEYPWAPSPLR